MLFHFLKSTKTLKKHTLKLQLAPRVRVFWPLFVFCPNRTFIGIFFSGPCLRFGIFSPVYSTTRYLKWQNERKLKNNNIHTKFAMIDHVSEEGETNPNVLFRRVLLRDFFAVGMVLNTIEICAFVIYFGQK